ncbi:exodeoxyribonuclease VII large subunit [bacterium]|nr:exodeoxyribonuclease VII large subunit [bacterium]
MQSNRDEHILTISQLTRQIKDVLERQFGTVSVAGEISNFHRHSSGHWYFTLKDVDAQLSAVMFRGSAQGVFFRPENGMEVVCTGRLTVYEPRGNYQIVVSAMQPRGAGALQIAFDKLKRKLHDEGLFDDARKRALPPYPSTVALVTSKTGAAVRDMISVIRRRNPSVQLVMLPVQVQGAVAAQQIADALDLCNEYNLSAKDTGIDVIITGRGGGSIEDLWAFNEEIVARAIARSHIPVISAVGHEVDYTIADFAADRRAATPSVAGEIVVPSRSELLRDLENITFTAWKFVDSSLYARRQQLRLLLGDRAFSRLEGQLSSAVQTVDDRHERMRRSVKQALDSRRHGIELAAQRLAAQERSIEKRTHTVEVLKQRLAAHNPAHFFRRGAVLIRRGDEPVTSVHQLQPGDFISLTLRDGNAQANILQTEDHGEKDK